jgi:hypothetical protein
MQTTCYVGVKSNENTVQIRLGMYLSYTCHEMLYTCQSVVYPDMQQLYFESIFPYLLGSLGCLDLIGGTSQTHCMVFQSRNLINHCSDSDLRIMGIYRYISRMKPHILRVYQYILGTYTLNASFTLNQALSARALRRRRLSHESHPHAPCLLRSLLPASRMSSQHSDHPGGACHEQNSTATG